MVEDFVAGALLGHVYECAGGTPVRLRMAPGSDLRAIEELLERSGVGASELSAARFVYFDPRHEYVVCATALIDGQVVLLGVGAARLDRDEPELELVVAPGHAERDVRRLLTSALTNSAAAISRARAA